MPLLRPQWPCRTSCLYPVNFQWFVSTTNSGHCTTLFKVKCTHDQPEAQVKFSIVLSNSLTWTLAIGSIPVPPSTIPAIPSTLLHCQHLTSLIQILNNSKICIGNPDEKFVSRIEGNHGSLLDQTGTRTYTHTCARAHTHAHYYNNYY